MANEKKCDRLEGPGALYPLQKKDIRPAAMMLADAFQPDPVWSAVFGDIALAKKTCAFETPVRYGLTYGEVYAPSPALEGVAAWVPGALADMTFWRILRSGALLSGMRVGAQVTKRMLPIFRPVEIARQENMKGKRYFYLQILGVAPAFQGQGFAGKLLRAFIEKSEQTGVALYLETETEANVSMYEHFGFRVIKKTLLPVINLPMWEMTRGV